MPVQIDLLLIKNQTLVLVEVKARRAWAPLDKVLGYKQRQRLLRQAQGLASRYPHFTVRVDAMLITPHFPVFKHYRNLFSDAPTY